MLCTMVSDGGLPVASEVLHNNEFIRLVLK